ncbi:hypothetical protein MUN89_08440 [Halobacillus salinarum]|uniref:Four helix bundle protein n=1 Tax=Halobacillus salinarum TaxID=2932257 RepID=A0ABY4EP13_9BACI|nr:hypothetical protein [Halobacillus salinarum]UOQ45934.1 hypothetical protein MUN89_08440 [Halobacillus salinarum]
MTKRRSLPEETRSSTTLYAIYLVKKSNEAYRHAKYTAETTPAIAEEICRTCAWICKRCVQTISKWEIDDLEGMKELCKMNAYLCESLIEESKAEGK